MYRANRHQAIALAIQRPYGGAALTTIDAVYKLLPKLRNEFPELNIQVADSQKRCNYIYIFGDIYILSRS